MKLLRDTWLVFGRYFGLLIHNPVWIALGVLQPLLYLILFAPLLKPIASMRGFGPGGAYNVFVPGLLVQLGMFGAAGVGFSLIAELRMGVIERLRVTPVSRVALLLGRALRDVISIVVQSLILILLALPFGLSIHPVGIVIVLALIGLIGLLTASVAYAVALAVRSEDSYALSFSHRRFRSSCCPASCCLLAWRRSGCATSRPSTRCHTRSTRRGPSSTTASAIRAWPRAWRSWWSCR